MLDIKLIRDNPDLIKTSLKNRNIKLDIDALLGWDKQWRTMNAEVEGLKRQRNTSSDEMAELVKQKQDITAKRASLKQLSQKIKEIDEKVGEIKQKIENIVIAVPNVPHASVPIGKNSAANKIIKQWGREKEFEFVVARYGDDNLLLSGWIIGEEKLYNKPAVVDITLGEGHIVLYGFGVQNRAQSWGTLKLLFNALYL